jgi:hypothetical protein
MHPRSLLLATAAFLTLSCGPPLDPHESLPAAYRNNGLQVHVAARALTNVACVHMAGIIVEVTGIRTR